MTLASRESLLHWIVAYAMFLVVWYHCLEGEQCIVQIGLLTLRVLGRLE